MKLNLGSGDRYVPGWVNVDLPGMPHRVDEYVDLNGDLPWQPDSIECVYAGHVLEHLYYDDAHRLLERLLQLVKKPGAIMLVGPDLDRARELFADDDSPDEFGITYNSLRNGADRWSGDVHRWDCTETALVKLLTAAGWSTVTPMSVEEVAINWPVADARPKWQCAVGALKL